MNVTKMYVTDEDRDTIAWVREHGGLDLVKAEWRSRVPYDRYVARRQRLLGHIAECETALGRRRERIEELEGLLKAFTHENAELRRRAMPEGMEWLIEAWPKFEEDAPVKLGDMALIDGDVDMVEAVQIWIHGKPVIYGDNGSQQLEKGECVKRPAPAVLAADGRPLREWETAWGTKGGSYHLTSVHDGKVFARHVGGSFGAEVESAGGSGLYRLRADKLTHTKPEVDTWERIEEDAESVAKLFDNLDADASEDIREIVRRCRALAERERGE